MKKSLLFSLICATLWGVAACDTHDRQMQQEIAAAREQVARAEAELARAKAAVRDEPSAPPQASSGDAILSEAQLRSNLESVQKKIQSEAQSAFPGYRIGSLELGEISYVYGAAMPYRAHLQLRVEPVTVSAMTPTMPPIPVEMQADPSGSWSPPLAGQLRDLQARSWQLQQSPAQPPPATQPTATAPQRPSGAVNVWGEPVRQQPTPARQNPQRVPSNLPPADDTRVIQFND